MGLVRTIKDWFPCSPVRAEMADALSRLYRDCSSYHEMTAEEAKADHPQVKLLQCLIEPGHVYVEVGCGGGTVCAEVGKMASVRGFDVSPFAVELAKRRCSGLPVALECADAAALPVSDEVVDGCYAFEVLEHVWDPVTVLREMARITRPGGFLLISAPLFFSLDLHLDKRAMVRACEYMIACLRLFLDGISGRPFTNVQPHLVRPVYPDCDLISALIPRNLVRAVEHSGCWVEFCDTTYMCAHREGSQTDLAFQRRNGHWLFRHFGDHLLLLARKKGKDSHGKAQNFEKGKGLRREGAQRLQHSGSGCQ